MTMCRIIHSALRDMEYHIQDFLMQLKQKNALSTSNLSKPSLKSGLRRNPRRLFEMRSVMLTKQSQDSIVTLRATIIAFEAAVRSAADRLIGSAQKRALFGALRGPTENRRILTRHKPVQNSGGFGKFVVPFGCSQFRPPDLSATSETTRGERT